MTIRVEMSANKGSRRHMEDVVQCKGIYINGKFILAACVFDGHGGKDAARYASVHLVDNILNDNDPDGPLGKDGSRNGFEITHTRMETEYSKSIRFK
jgi:serine/threonine protein phosphatase PrpC